MALTDDLFESIDTIVKARIASLPYDQTIEGEIIDISNADKGVYIVRSQISSLRALGTPSYYSLGDDVYVQVPQSDYKKDCIILSKKINEITTEKTALPFTDMVHTETNYFRADYISKEVEIRTTADGKETTIKIPTINISNPIAGYSKLGLKFAVSADMKKEMESGNYGVVLVLKGYNQKVTYLNYSKAILSQNLFGQNNEFAIISNEDMVGINLYNTLGFCNQQKVFDIKNLVITQIEAYLWQDGNFKSVDGMDVENRSIKFTNFQLYIGYDKDYFANQTELFELYTYDGLIYNNNYNKKEIFHRYLTLKDDNIVSVLNLKFNIGEKDYYEPDITNSTSTYSFYYILDNNDFDDINNYIYKTAVKGSKETTKIIFKNGAYFEDENLSEYLRYNNERIQNNLEKIIAAIKQINSSIQIDLE